MKIILRWIILLPVIGLSTNIIDIFLTDSLVNSIYRCTYSFFIENGCGISIPFGYINPESLYWILKSMLHPIILICIIYWIAPKFKKYISIIYACLYLILIAISLSDSSGNGYNGLFITFYSDIKILEVVAIVIFAIITPVVTIYLLENRKSTDISELMSYNTDKNFLLLIANYLFMISMFLFIFSWIIFFFIGAYQLFTISFWTGVLWWHLGIWGPIGGILLGVFWGKWELFTIFTSVMILVLATLLINAFIGIIFEITNKQKEQI